MTERSNPPFGQVVTAVLTPFTEEGAVDYEAFWRLLKFLAENGSDGVLVSGTTGESPTLSVIEKLSLYKTAVEAVGGKMQVIAGTGTYDTKESVELTREAVGLGVDGVLAVTPYYSKPPQEGLFRHFVAIADASEVPVMLYNIPGRTARLIQVETLKRLAVHPRIVAVKDAVDDIDFSRRELDQLPDDFAVYAGSDGMTRGIVEAGGVGVVSVASHIAGPQMRLLVEAAAGGDSEEAERLEADLQPLFSALFLEPNPMPLKAGMNALWGPVGDPRLPLITATDETLAAIELAVGAVRVP
jgi:4-hydroxy-tetrahydrodipicolinate synthase